MVLVSAGFGFDPLFAEIDRALFLGHDPWRVTHAIFSPMATYAIDRAYHGWFAPMSLGVLLCAFGARRSYRLRTQYLLSYIAVRSEEHTSELQSLMRISYAVFCLKKKKNK